VHALVLSAVLIFPLFAPLPVPALLAPGLAWAPERVVQPVDISLPAPAPTPTPASPSNPSPQRAETPALAAPLEPPTSIPPETGQRRGGGGPPRQGPHKHTGRGGGGGGGPPPPPATGSAFTGPSTAAATASRHPGAEESHRCGAQVSGDRA